MITPTPKGFSALSIASAISFDMPEDGKLSVRIGGVLRGKWRVEAVVR